MLVSNHKSCQQYILFNFLKSNTVEVLFVPIPVNKDLEKFASERKALSDTVSLVLGSNSLNISVAFDEN